MAGVMESNDARINDLRAKGYDPVYIWKADPGEVDPPHQHAFTTYLAILEGELSVEMQGKQINLSSGDELEVSRGTVHAAMAGVRGCQYIVAEKH